MRTRSNDVGAPGLRRSAALFVLVGVLLASVGTVAATQGAAADDLPRPMVGAHTAAYRPVGPLRVLDTRAGGAPSPTPRSTTTVSLRGLVGIPADAVAAAVAIIATESTGPGFITVWGDGERPQTSALNLDTAGQTRANFAIVPIGAGGDIHLYTHGGGHLVVDLSGVFTPAATSASGRFVGIGPSRLLDTRLTHQPLAPGERRPIDVTRIGVPADASAVAISFSAIGPVGWFAAWQPGQDWPGTSAVNTSTANSPATATAIVPIRDGQMLVGSLNGGDIVVDVTGYMTGTNAPYDDDGLFVPVAPTRVYDSRDPIISGRPLAGGTTITRRVMAADVASALAVSITAVDAAGAGFITAYPARTTRPNTASVNVDAGQTLATGAITANAVAGTSVFTLGTMHLVIDVTGYFVTGGQTMSEPPVVDAPKTTQPAATPVAPTTNSYRLAMLAPDGSAARWDPCSSIDVQVNFAGAQPSAREDLADALAQATAATGLQFVVNETDSTARSNGLHTLTVLWLTERELPAFKDGTVGIGGGAYTSEQILEAWVYIDADDPLIVPGTDRSVLLDVLLHELGHALGLAHVGDDSQVMFPYVHEHGAYQAGDLVGLSLLGATQGCFDSSPRSLSPPIDAAPAAALHAPLDLDPADLDAVDADADDGVDAPTPIVSTFEFA